MSRHGKSKEDRAAIRFTNSEISLAGRRSHRRNASVHAGMTSRSEKDATPVHPGDMRAQLRQVCENIGRALRSVGGDYSDVVKTTTFTTDVEGYHRVNDERAKYFKSDLPTSALIGVEMGRSGLPWDAAAHDELLISLLGQRNPAGGPRLRRST